MISLSSNEAERAVQLQKRRGELKNWLVVVRTGKKFQIVVPDENAPVEPLFMVKMMALPEEARALAEAEVEKRLAGVEAKMKDLGVALD